MLEMLKQNSVSTLKPSLIFRISSVSYTCMYTAYKVVCKNCNFLYRVTTKHTTGVRQGGGGGGQGGTSPPPPHFQKWGGISGFVPPLLDRGNVLNSLFCSYFVVKNKFFIKKLLARFARQL